MDNNTTNTYNNIITPENVQDIGERIAVSATKIYARYVGKLSNLYRGLLKDVFRPSICRNYSDGYDIAQSVICFLCEHMGKRLDDVIGKKKGGTLITVMHACYSVVYKHLGYEITKMNKDVCIYDLKGEDAPTVPFEPDPEMSNTAVVDDKLAAMGLNAGELETLNCYMGGMQFVETARFLAVNNATVWRRIKKVQAKYVAAFGAYS